MVGDTKYMRVNSTNYVDVLTNTTAGLPNFAEVNKNIYLKSLYIVNEDAIAFGFYAAVENSDGTFVVLTDTITSLTTIFWENPTGLAIPYGGKFKVKVGVAGTVGIEVIPTFIGGA